MKEIDFLCKQIQELGHDIKISTEWGRIYVYFDSEVSFSTDANKLGLSNITVYLGGVLKGISIQTFKLSSILQKKTQTESTESSISRCLRIMFDGTLNRLKVSEVMEILKTIDLSKATDDELSKIVTILKGIENDLMLSDEVDNYLIFLIDNMEKFTKEKIIVILNSFKDKIGKIQSWHS
jgi:hypothetical protein